jgi:hypothetical protein
MNAATPIPVIPLEYARTDTSRRHRIEVRVCLALAAVTCLVGWGLIFVDTETVVVSGCVLLLAGVGVFVFSLRMKFRPGMGLGLAHCALPALFVGLVNGLGWGPQTAHVPFLVMGAIYNLLVSIPATVWAYVRLRRLDHVLPLAGGVAEDGP